MSMLVISGYWDSWCSVFPPFFCVFTYVFSKFSTISMWWFIYQWRVWSAVKSIVVVMGMKRKATKRHGLVKDKSTGFRGTLFYCSSFDLWLVDVTHMHWDLKKPKWRKPSRCPHEAISLTGSLTAHQRTTWAALQEGCVLKIHCMN